MSLFLDRNRIYPVPTELTIFGNNNFHTGTTKYNTMKKKEGAEINILSLSLHLTCHHFVFFLLLASERKKH